MIFFINFFGLMLKIYVVRHGQDEDNFDGILNWHRDRSLSEKWVLQAKDLANKIKWFGLDFDVVYVSPLKRAKETAQILIEEKNSDFVVLDNLIERDFGVMSWKKIEDIKKLCSPNILSTEKVDYFLDPEGAETFPDLLKRAKIVLNYIENKHKKWNILLVCHGDIWKMLYAAFYNLFWKSVLKSFYFGNSDMILLDKSSSVKDARLYISDAKYKKNPQ